MINTEAKLVGILERQFAVDPSAITPATRFQEDIDADSLEVVELIMSVEETFGIEVPDEDAENLRTVGDLVAYIECQQMSGTA